jgi:hypothetical protein
MRMLLLVFPSRAAQQKASVSFRVSIEARCRVAHCHADIALAGADCEGEDQSAINNKRNYDPQNASVDPYLDINL